MGINRFILITPILFYWLKILKSQKNLTFFCENSPSKCVISPCENSASGIIVVLFEHRNGFGQSPHEVENFVV